MEASRAPLRLISRKFLPSQPTELPRRGGPSRLNARWLWPTADRRGRLLDEYVPTFRAVRELQHHEPRVRQFREALKTQRHSAAEEAWAGLHTALAAQQPSPLSSPEQPAAPTSPRRLEGWRDLPRSWINYSPPCFDNAINDIVRHAASTPGLVRALVRPRESPLDAFVLAECAFKLGKRDPASARQLLEVPGWQAPAMRLALTAWLDATCLDAGELRRLLERVDIPEDFRLPSYVLARLTEQKDARAAAESFETLAEHGMLDAQASLDKVLRYLYTGSDRGSLVVRQQARRVAYPPSFYPFLVRRLCERVAAGDAAAKSELDGLFNDKIVALAGDEPGIVLHLLVMRIIATDGVQATSTVLNRWVETDPKGVSEDTWLLLFQAFRRMGRPDKCMGVLNRALQAHPRLGLPFVGEYLLYAANFYNLGEYLRKLRLVVPEMQPVLGLLGVLEHARTLTGPTARAREAPLAPVPVAPGHELRPENRAFHVQRLHESLLNITYQAVLATVDSKETALHLFEKYVQYVTETSRNARTSLRVVDQFVALLCALPSVETGAAEQVYRTALEKLRRKRPANGKNHSKSLEAICYKYAVAGEHERAVSLLVEAAMHGETIRYSTMRPWLKRLPERTRRTLVQWASDHAGVVAPPTAAVCT